VERGFVAARIGFVAREATVLFLMVLPILVIVLLLAFAISEVLAWALFAISLAVFAALELSSLLAFVLGRRYLECVFWRVPEDWLTRLAQMEQPRLRPSEEVIYTTFATQPGWLMPDLGRFTLTTERVIYQQPRYRFLPPRRPGRKWEYALDEIASVSGEVTSSLEGIIRSGKPFPVLKIQSRDGDELALTLMAARGWAKAIRRARRALLKGNPS
jgi:hypothetical protein